MSKIKSIQPSYQPVIPEPGKKNYKQSPSFGRAEISDDALKALEGWTKDAMKDEIKFLSPKWCFQKLGSSKGEIQTQLINNLFTATLAPAVIRYNPFSDKSDKDKAYLAWRQPLSSVTAFGVNLPLTMAMNSYLHKIYDEGFNKDIDLRWAPSKGYLKKQFKQAKGVKTPSLIWNKETKANFEKYSKTFKRYRNNVFIRLLSEDPGENNSNFILDKDTKTISVRKNGKLHKIGKNIPNINTQEDLNTFIKENNFYNRTVGDLLQKEFHAEVYKGGVLDGKLIPDIEKSVLDKTKALDFIKALGLVDDNFTDSQLKEITKKLMQAKDIKEYTKDLKSGSISKEEIERVLRLRARDGKLNARSNQLDMGHDLGTETTATLGQFLHQLEYKYKPTKENDKSIQDLADTKISDILTKFKGIFTEYKIKEFNTEATSKDFAKNMLERLSKRNTSYASTHISRVSMLVNIPIMFITCLALNWLYPAFMNKFKPDLVKSHEHEGRAK